MALVVTDDKHYKDIADGLRELAHGSNATFAPEEMARDMLDICYQRIQMAREDGEYIGNLNGKQAEYDRFWDDFQKNGDRRDYTYSFGVGWTPETFKPKYPIRFNDTDANTRHSMGTFMAFGRLQGIVLDLSTIDIDFSGCKTMTYTFRDSRVDNIYVDGSNLVSMVNTFTGTDGEQYHPTTLTLKVTDKCTSYNNTFNYCKGLTNLTFVEGSVIAASINFAQSSLLTQASLQSIVDALEDITGKSKTCTLTLHPTTVSDVLTESQRAQILGKGWSIAS